ncbi:MAG TPA: ATP-binding protein [Clostridiales bacterium]|nr:ATP-binding protein [Clostridiales bacterium]
MRLLFEKKIFGYNPNTVKHLISDMMDCLNRWNELEEEEEFEFRLILNELIANGIMHGNKKCEQKALTASIYEVNSDTVSIYIQDEGIGFNYQKIICEECIPYMEGGRGLKIIMALCDDMEFSYNGSRVKVSKSVKRE